MLRLRPADLVLTSAGIAVALAVPVEAYIGPGAGFAFLTSLSMVFLTILAAGLAVLLWPFRAMWRLVCHGRRPKPLIRRLIIVGLDGQEPKLTDRLMAEGKLPNFEKLAQSGCYHRLRSTFPSVSPVAWSSFATGTHPAKHSVFDFLNRDRHTYLPRLSSTHVGRVKHFFKLGRYRIPLQRPELRLLRRSRSFWSILGERYIWSTILRVPITFPPDKFYGAELSGMSVPDLLGTQGTFTLLTTRTSGEGFREGGIRLPLEREGERCAGVLRGPANNLVEGEPPLELPIALEVDQAAGRARVTVGGKVVDLDPQRLSSWIGLSFRAAPGVKVSGICKMMVAEMEDHVSLYVTPISIDPEHPAMPVSHPSYYAAYLALKIGPYSTLGLAEDTWALNEGVIDEGTFLQQTYEIDAERQAMFFAALESQRQGLLTCVFDATDRIQHMFWRYLDDVEPQKAEHGNAIEDLYRHNDALVGRLLEEVGSSDVVMIISDHGFSAFHRGANLNSWLHAAGYLKLRDGCDGTSEWLRDVDWSQTRAYAFGLVGVFLNLQGREAHGIVQRGAEEEKLKAELKSRLSGLVDEEEGEIGIREAFVTAKLYSGPYLDDAPDLLIGYNAGYRVSWDCATGVVAGPVFEDNLKAWSGDHCIDPRLVPGVFFCNRKVDADDPALIDIAPTALRLFGVEPPTYMDGKPLFETAASPSGDRRRGAASVVSGK